MKSIYKNRGLYAPVIANIRREYGGFFADAIVREADRTYWRMKQQIGDVPKAHKPHLDSVLERAALYRTLKEARFGQAYDRVMAPVHKRNMKVNRTVAGFTGHKGGAKLFLRLMYKLGDSVFSEKAGHRKEWKVREKHCAAFDMLECPYVTYCNALNLPELSKSFCDDDIEVFDNLPNIKYTRPITLGNGGEKCDFRMELDLNV